MSTRSARYTSVAIALHWAIALAIIFMIWLGWNMEEKEAALQLHKSIGITILLATIARIVWRLLNPPPPLPAEMKPLEKTASHLAHLGFYGLMLAMPLTGWLLVSSHPRFDIPTVLFGTVSWPDLPGVDFLKNDFAHEIIEFVHSKLAWVTIILLALHVGGALKHEFSAEEGVLKRMLPGLFGKTDPPAAPPKGFLAAFGAAIGAFILIAGLPLLGGTSAPAPADTNAGFSANWTVDMDNSAIRFSGAHDGNRYSGVFESWTADIQFDPDQPEAGRASVIVQTASAKANQKLYTDSLKAAEWLNPDAFPVATVEITGMSATTEGYTSTARLELKGLSVTVPFNFEITFEGDTALMTGQAILQRGPLDLGQQSDPGGDWVGEEVTVDVNVTAQRLTGGQ